MDDLPDLLLCLIFSRLPARSDLNAMSLVCKRFYEIDVMCKSSLVLYRGFRYTDSSLSSLCARFRNLSKIDVNCVGRKKRHIRQLEDKDLKTVASRCTGLLKIHLTYCGLITDAGLKHLTSCKFLQAVKLHFVLKITGRGLSLLLTRCKNLSLLHLVACSHLGGTDWLACLTKLEDLAIQGCHGVNEGDLSLLGQAWTRLRRFRFQGDKYRSFLEKTAPDGLRIHDINWEKLEELELVNCLVSSNHGLWISWKCTNLVRIHLDTCMGLTDRHVVGLARSCPGLKSFALTCPSGTADWSGYRFELTDTSLKAIAEYCKLVEEVRLMFSADCLPPMPYFSPEGILAIVGGCKTLRTLVLNRVYVFNDVGMEALCSACVLERLELIHCPDVSDHGMHLISRLPALKSLRLSRCRGVSDHGLAAFTGSDKLECLRIETCPNVSEMGVKGLGKIVHYSCDLPCCDESTAGRILHGHYEIYP